MKKRLNVDLVQNELRGGSAFFPGYKSGMPAVEDQPPRPAPPETPATTPVAAPGQNTGIPETQKSRNQEFQKTGGLETQNTSIPEYQHTIIPETQKSRIPENPALAKPAKREFYTKATYRLCDEALDAIE